MMDTVLWGAGPGITPRPAEEWLGALRARAPQMRQTLRLTGAARAVREFAVCELPRLGAALTPEHVGGALSLAVDEVVRILDELEPRLFFLVRNAQGAVSWAFPVTAEPTPHRLHLAAAGGHWENIFGA